ncbi:MAG: hypothetical protein ACI9M9_002366, partial [Flavobacteriaceae bacterium]
NEETKFILVSIISLISAKSRNQDGKHIREPLHYISLFLDKIETTIWNQNIRNFDSIRSLIVFQNAS